MNGPMRSILVTGSSSGIGRAISEHLLAQGHRVIGIARDHSKFTPDSEQYVPVTQDLGASDAILPRLKDILRDYPDIDAVVSNAGAGSFETLESYSAQQITDYLRCNLLSHVLVARALVPHLKTLGRGDLIFMGSESALRGARKGSLYCTAKFGIRGLAQSLRAECVSRNVRVSIINPGMVRTPFFDGHGFRPGADESNAVAPEDVAAAVSMIFEARPGTVFDEINLSPQRQVVVLEKKPRD